MDRESLSIAIAWMIGAIITYIVMSIWCPCANAADYAIVSFDSPEHLAALQDSVVGVGNSIRIDTLYNCYRDSVNHQWIDYLGNVFTERSISWIDTTFISRTCRRLVGVTITKEQGIREIKCYDKQGQYSHTEATMKPGQAIIFYELYKEEQ